MELLLIIRHDPADPVPMQVPGHLRQLIARFGELEQGVLKQLPVVRLEVDLSPVPQDPPVQHQEVLVGEPPPGVLVGGPWVAEIDVDPVGLPRGK